MKLKGQTALITGASPRHRRSHCPRPWPRKGPAWRLPGDRRPSWKPCRKEFGGPWEAACESIVADLAEKGAVEKVWDRSDEGSGGVDILVNNAGMGSSAKPMPVVSYEDAFWET